MTGDLHTSHPCQGVRDGWWDANGNPSSPRTRKAETDTEIDSHYSLTAKQRPHELRTITKLAILGGVAIIWAISKNPQPGHESAATQINATTEAFRLVRAIGNDEYVIGKGMSLNDCRNRKSDYVAVNEIVTGLGGSVTCQPESYY
ncbi:hypothetical protein RQ479_06245 [Mesorhizobium sp. ISC25]|uniref:hypothetical protein n=1 Tax=Mesorhizobium sp. ISC25 TaxID=3077335 RepID=UPI0035D9C13D